MNNDDDNNLLKAKVEFNLNKSKDDNTTQGIQSDKIKVTEINQSFDNSTSNHYVDDFKEKYYESLEEINNLNIQVNDLKDEVDKLKYLQLESKYIPHKLARFDNTENYRNFLMELNSNNINFKKNIEHHKKTAGGRSSAYIETIYTYSVLNKDINKFLELADKYKIYFI